MKRMMATIGLATLIAVAAPVAAESPVANLDGTASLDGVPSDVAQRIDRFQQRILKGARTGSLTKNESNRLQRELERIRQLAEALKDQDGGTLSAANTIHIQDRLDQLGASIHDQKNDAHYNL